MQFLRDRSCRGLGPFRRRPSGQPLDDLRASAGYRSRAAAGLLTRFFLETRPDAPLAAAQTRAFAAEDLAGGGG